MACKSCRSDNQTQFPTEMNVHFPGKENWEKPSVWLFPSVLICLDCGFAEFSIDGDGLPKLQDVSPSGPHLAAVIAQSGRDNR